MHVTTVPISLLTHLGGQASYMRRLGFRLHVITSPGPELAAFAQREEVEVHTVPMKRAITPLGDVVALWRLCRLLRRIRPDIVHSHTPKGGLLGMLAAGITGIPVRIYHLRGLPLLTASGLRQQLLRLSEWTSCSLAHRVLAVSHSMRVIAIEEKLCKASKIKVLRGGSGNGVDAAGRFKPAGSVERLAARSLHAIPEDAVVIGFVGRLAREKGIVELASAWRALSERNPRVHLLLVGWLEIQDVPPSIVAALRSDPRVHLTGPVPDTARLYAAMDVVALPTYREGFPNVALEAAAMALPIVGTSVPGCVDAVQDGVTGTLVPARDANALSRALERYASDATLREQHGEAGRRRVLAEFQQEAIWSSIDAEYRDALERSLASADASRQFLGVRAARCRDPRSSPDEPG